MVTKPAPMGVTVRVATTAGHPIRQAGPANIQRLLCAVVPILEYACGSRSETPPGVAGREERSADASRSGRQVATGDGSGKRSDERARVSGRVVGGSALSTRARGIEGRAARLRAASGNRGRSRVRRLVPISVRRCAQVDRHPLVPASLYATPNLAVHRKE